MCHNINMNKLIISNPKILGGESVIKGTRIPISLIFDLLKDGYSSEAIHSLYPHLSTGKINGVIEEINFLINSDNFRSNCYAA